MIEEDNPLKSELVRIGRRIREMRQSLNLTGKQCAARMGVSESQWNHYERGRSNLTLLQAAKVAKVLDTTVDALLGGLRISRNDSRSPIAMRLPRGRMVPRATPEQVVAIAKEQLSYDDIEDVRAVYIQCSEQSLIYDMPDESMEPAIARGAQVVVDRARMPSPGDHVLVVLLASSTVLLRRFRRSGESKGGIEPPYSLQPENPDWEPIVVTKAHKPVFMGTKVQYSRTGSR